MGRSPQRSNGEEIPRRERPLDNCTVLKKTHRQITLKGLAALHGYKANSVARSLRQKRTYTIGVIVPEISEGYSTAVLSGIEDELLKDGFFYFVVSHRHRADLLEGYPHMMLARSVEGIIAVDSPMESELPIPVVSVSGHQRHEGVINIERNHDAAAHLALSHLHPAAITVHPKLIVRKSTGHAPMHPSATSANPETEITAAALSGKD